MVEDVVIVELTNLVSQTLREIRTSCGYVKKDAEDRRQSVTTLSEGSPSHMRQSGSGLDYR